MKRILILLAFLSSILFISMSSGAISLPHSYYNFSESNQNISSDQIGKANLTNLTDTHFITNGKIYRGYNVSLEKAFSVNNINVSQNWTFTFWINQYGLTRNGDIVLGTGNGGTQGSSAFYLSLDENKKLSFAGYDGTPTSVTSSGILPTGQWAFVSLLISNDSVALYINNSLQGTLDSFDYSGLTATNLTFFGLPSANHLTNVSVDEIGIWNKTLSTNELSDLYNLGLGNSYPFDLLNEEYQTWNNITNVGATESFLINVTYDSGSYPSIIGVLTYNATNYTGTKAGTGNSITFQTNITIPNILVGEQNNTFYWTIKLTDSNGDRYFRSQDYNQTVRRVTVDNCGTNTNRAYNFTMFDEDSLILINPTAFNTSIEVSITLSSAGGLLITNYSNNFTKINPVSICFSSNLNTTSLISDVVVRYDADNYVSEFYNEQKLTLTNNTMPRNIPLYDLLTSRSQEFKMTFKDASLLPLADYLVQLNRKYISDGSYKTVEIGKTDGDGLTLGHFVLSDAYYRLTLTKDNSIIYIYPDFQASCENLVTGECSLTKYIFNPSPTLEGLYTQEGIQYTQLSYNETTRVVTTSFNSVDGSSQTITLNATDTRGNQLVSQTLTSSSGTLSITLPALSVGGGQSNLTVVTILQKGNKALTIGFINLNEKPSDLFGSSRVILIVGIILVMVGMGISSGGATLVLMLLGLVLSASLGLTSASGNISVLGIGGSLLAGIIFVVVFLIKKSRTSGGDI